MKYELHLPTPQVRVKDEGGRGEERIEGGLGFGAQGFVYWAVVGEEAEWAVFGAVIGGVKQGVLPGRELAGDGFAQGHVHRLFGRAGEGDVPGAEIGRAIVEELVDQGRR